MASGVKSKGVDLDELFDPDIVGDGPIAAGIKSNGVAIKYAALKYGTKRADVGIADAGVDVSNKWAAKGTASYTLPINGNVYTASTNITAGNSGYARIGFRIVTGNTWQVYGYDSITAITTVFASGAVPASATNVKYTFGAPTVPTNQTSSGGATTNTASASTAISSNPLAYYETATATATSGSRALSYPFTIDFFNAAASNISHTAITLVGDTEGSV